MEKRGSTRNPASALAGLLFVCFGIDERIRVLQTSGVSHIVGNGLSPLMLDDQEMHALA
jgi:hypothetical protein